MSTPSNHWKLGLFVTLGFVMSLVTMVILGARTLQRESIPYTFYFDESVQGLEKGSPTKFRGVTVGSVAKIDVAPDRRRVEVTSDMDVTELTRLGLVELKGRKPHMLKSADLRVQLASQGLTGVKFLLIDFYDPVVYPPPDLPFAPPENYVPTATSTIKQLEDTVTKTVDRLPQIIDGLMALITRVNTMLETMDVKAISDQGLATLKTTNKVMLSVQASVEKLDAPGISLRVKSALDNLSGTLAQLNLVAARLSDDKGLLMSAQRTSDAMGRVARNTGAASAQLEDTLRGIQEAAESIQRVAEGLEKDPDMLIKGRKKTR